MHIALIGLFVSEYPISLANALSKENRMTLFLSLQNLRKQFPGVSDLAGFLLQQHIVAPDISLRLIDQPKGRFLYKVGVARNLARAIETLNPDLVHYQMGGDLWMLAALPGLRRLPKVVTLHDVIPHAGDYPPARVKHSINTLAPRWADQLIVHDELQAGALQATYRVPRSKIHTVPFGAFSIYRQLTPRQLPEEPNLVLFFGRILAYKGINYLMAAVPLVAHAIPEVRFLIVGGGDRLEPDSSGRVTIQQGFVPMDGVGSYFQRAALVVLPYTDALQSGVVSLAYVFGKPVVCTRVGSMAEIVDDGQTGYLVEPKDPAQLAEAIIKLLRDPDLRHQMGRRALDTAETQLGWDHVAASTCAIYAKAIESKRR
jgi:glycosyltransferase involved in cell wall biosynthesis